VPWFIKHETFTPETVALSLAQRRPHLEAHRTWVEAQRAAGIAIASGFLVDENSQPGGGGLLMVQAASFEAALELVQQDPMISGGLVTWSLQEWRPVAGQPLSAGGSP